CVASGVISSCICYGTRLPPTSPVFPYTTLFRSHVGLEAPEAGIGESVVDGEAFPNGAQLEHRIDVVVAGVGLVRRHRETRRDELDRKSTRLNSSHGSISYAVFCLKKKNTIKRNT